MCRSLLWEASCVVSIPCVSFGVWYTCAGGSIIGDVQFPLRVVAYFVLPDWS